MCAAVSCLWLAGLGQHTTQSQIMELCREHVPVDRVFQLPPPMHDQALVFFSDIWLAHPQTSMDHAFFCQRVCVFAQPEILSEDPGNSEPELMMA